MLEPVIINNREQKDEANKKTQKDNEKLTSNKVDRNLLDNINSPN